MTDVVPGSVTFHTRLDPPREYCGIDVDVIRATFAPDAAGWAFASFVLTGQRLNYDGTRKQYNHPDCNITGPDTLTGAVQWMQDYVAQCAQRLN